ncbi:MAG: SGNH/GDSL hydrolase family protein [bacterium]|nr:SGNH/GDSL hydrolase family protein [bacterium]
MELKGRIINVLGDSITEGVGASCEANRFTDVLWREYELQKVNNYGISGSRIAKQHAMTNERHERWFASRIEEMDPNADAVIVFGGTNDYGHGDAPLGSFEDRTVDTFYGACHVLMQGLMEKYVGKPVIICTPLHRDEENDPHDERKVEVHPLHVYRSILMEVAQYYAMPVLDLYAVSGIQPQNAVCREALCPDGLHPNDAGHAIVARRMGEMLKML